MKEKKLCGEIAVCNGWNNLEREWGMSTITAIDWKIRHNDCDMKYHYRAHRSIKSHYKDRLSRLRYKRSHKSTVLYHLLRNHSVNYNSLIFFVSMPLVSYKLHKLIVPTFCLSASSPFLLRRSPLRDFVRPLISLYCRHVCAPVLFNFFKILLVLFFFSQPDYLLTTDFS